MALSVYRARGLRLGEGNAEITFCRAAPIYTEGQLFLELCRFENLGFGAGYIQLGLPCCGAVQSGWSVSRTPPRPSDNQN
jgi:hypothetical protein